ncbi:MAG: 16S rRNA (guanine(527)-N(7))-methyltransferase RsmG [Bacteroidaceae bacterium]|nr:16S rRNA (guanine(527)-N(7))-methyltransferase RsmG [Bacteroidaceae bacterium]MBR3373389.1 16S rRNA (guanine(527)-N(7))-methyltransferase RsmG [Bacteroidaceae bacterium]MBR3733810.1 16S rRNA (guanine(527)-N(7))-methyltransferase RsmG [Bacteroidaceae bacterium]
MLTKISQYFPTLSAEQVAQLARLDGLYREWNDKINVISRKDIDNLYEHHVLHSLSIGKYISFRPATSILDVGTGGGFPGIPLAILFPQCRFHLIDSIGKKVKVATEVAKAIGLRNVRCTHENVKEERGRYDFVISRAVMNAPELTRLVQNKISRVGNNALPNGIICLKGGDLSEELSNLNRWHELTDISDYFSEPYFETKKILYIPI